MTGNRFHFSRPISLQIILPPSTTKEPYKLAALPQIKNYSHDCHNIFLKNILFFKYN